MGGEALTPHKKQAKPVPYGVSPRKPRQGSFAPGLNTKQAKPVPHSPDYLLKKGQLTPAPTINQWFLRII